jgi:fructose-bisphosphate aldolase class II
VYKPGNIKLQPIILKNSQEYIREKFSIKEEKPVDFVFHGGSGSSPEEISEALSYGAIKMNIDTDIQWAFWDGIREYYIKNEDNLQAQIGSSTDPDVPNKKFYDPRVWLRKGEESLVKRLTQAFEELNCINVN